MNDLQSEVVAIKVPVGGRSAVPPEELSRVLTKDRIQRQLWAIPNLIKHELDAALFANIIRENYLKIFAILLDIGAECEILKFLVRQEKDSRLPYAPEGLAFLDETITSHFVTTQWSYNPVLLGQSENGGIHRNLDEGNVLPFIHETHCGDGSSATVYKVEVLSSCQSILPSSKSLVRCIPSSHDREIN
jgi:hypothetical protein